MKIAKYFALSIIFAGLSIICLAQYPGGGTIPTQFFGSERLRSRVKPQKLIQLSEPNLTGQLSLEGALAKRRSVREFTAGELRFSEIGQLAWAGQGITEPKMGLRTSPSAGALYPIILYIVTERGSFIYDPKEHTLEQRSTSDLRGRLSAAALNQSAVADAACDIIVVGSAKILMERYRDQARRYMLLEAGHITQNILLQAVSLDLAGMPVAGFNFQAVREVCGLQRGQEPLYIICIGHPATEKSDQRQTQQKQTQQKQMQQKPSRGVNPEQLKQVVFIVPSMNFLDTELLRTQRELADAGVHPIIASTRIGVITGMSGQRAHSKLLITNIRVDDFQAVIFIGGTGISEYLFNPIAGRIINEAMGKDKIVAAISNAPNILANAGVLAGRKVTALPSEQIFLERAGAQYTGAYVEQDGQIITASSSQAAGQFGKTIAKTLTGR
ncbi:DJ-1/PfpI family protein [Planctomycetota bacterium]